MINLGTVSSPSFGIVNDEALEIVKESSGIENYFPTTEWRKSSLEKQGVDSDRLDRMYTRIKTWEIAIDSILIVKNGYLVYEEYFDYYNFSTIHQMWSATKSIMSILMGIANATGFIQNLDQPVLDIFPNRSFSNVDSRKQAITIRHLLKMQMGIEWRGVGIGNVNKRDYDLLTNQTEDWMSIWPVDESSEMVQMLHNNDSVQYILDQPMVIDPGTEFYYSAGATHLLSLILQKKTGMNTANFANNYLFTPLNITNYYWWNDSMGISLGPFGLWLRPLDMAKIGYLYLNNGTWDGTSIVPQEWVEISTVGDEVNSYYGYLWWIDSDFYYAFGAGGQCILVKPSQSLVITMTASEYQSNFPWTLIQGYILEAILEIPTSQTTSFQVSFILTESNVNTSIGNNTSGWTFFGSLFALSIILLRKKKHS